MSHKSAFRSSSIALAAAMIILSVVAIPSGLRLAAARHPGLTVALPISSVSTANQHVQGQLPERRAGTLPQRRSVFNSESQQVRTKKSLAARQARRQTSIPLTHPGISASSPDCSLLTASSVTPQVSVPVTINVNNGELLSELLQIQQQIKGLTDHRQAAAMPAAMPAEAMCDADTVFRDQIELDRRTTSTTVPDLKESSGNSPSPNDEEFLAPSPLMEIQPISEAPMAASSLSIGTLPGKGSSALVASTEEYEVNLTDPESLLEPELQSVASNEAADTVELERLEPQLTLQEQEQELEQELIILVPDSVEVRPRNSVPESQLEFETYLPQISVAPVPPPLGEPLLFPEILEQADSVDPLIGDPGVEKDVAAAPRLRVSAIPPLPTADPRIASGGKGHFPVSEQRYRSPAPSVAEAHFAPTTSNAAPSKRAVLSNNAVTGVRHRMNGFFRQPPQPDFDPPQWIDDLADWRERSARSVSKYFVQDSTQNQPRSAPGRQHIVPGQDLRQAQHALGKQGMMTTRPAESRKRASSVQPRSHETRMSNQGRIRESAGSRISAVDSPESAANPSAGEVLEPIRNSQVMHRVTSAVRFAARPKTVD